MKHDRILVIGSNSFSGASFTGYLLRKGIRVVGVSRSEEPHRAMLPYRWHGHDDLFRFHRLDLNHDLDRLSDLIHTERFTCVVNFAAQSMVAESWENPGHWFKTNVVSTVLLHERLRQMDFLDRYVHITTPEVYGSTSVPVKEDAPFRPTTPYAVSRAAADMSLRTYIEAYRFPAVMTRASNVYGPGQQLYRIIPRTILFILLGKKLQLHGGGLSRRSFIYVEDVSDAILRIAEEGRNGETYHIATQETITIRELVERLCARLGVSLDECVEITPERRCQDAACLLDSSKLRESLGWQEQVGLDEGLDRCIRWVRESFEDLRDLPHDYIHKA
ncbi:MAG: GDP-mannose 4,6-dehydratase [Acidobacteriota bacterium]